MSNLQIIEPIAITDAMVGSGAGTVPEVEHPEWVGDYAYNALQKVIVKGTQGIFVDLVVGTKNWWSMAAAPNGDVYACVIGASIWKQTAGVGSFIDLATGNKQWSGMAVAPSGTAYGVYACVYAVSILISTFEVVHKIYQSLTAGNISRYPPIDIKQTTPQWVEVEATNKWKVFDGKIANQMQVVSPAVYTITPGVAFNSVALLNVEATTVRIQVNSPAYDQSVSTGISDIVKTDLAGGVASVLTITITNTAGLAKCGEIVVGNTTILGALDSSTNPVWSFDDYSTKERDVFGDWKIIPRSDSEKLNFNLITDYASQDTVAAFVRANKLTPLVFIGNPSFATLINYGILKSVSIPIKFRGKTLIPMEVDGLV